MKTFHCDKCAQQVFFENTVCWNCNSTLGYQPQKRVVSSFEKGLDGNWHSLDPTDAGRLYKQCDNYVKQHVCNWMLDANDVNELCASCQLTVVIPALSNEGNHVLWHRMESAKRRLLYSLWSLRLRPVPKQEDAICGLAFQFLEDGNSEEKIMTGHDNGLITLNLAEADPAKREHVREQMGERYRTLLGHFRHESGHYYFDRLITDPELLDKYRELFGDESQGYAERLKLYYEKGPIADWEQSFISCYASSHPSEDWAETWAHYLHMIDTLETAHACGLSLKPLKAKEPKMMLAARTLTSDSFEQLITDWFSLTYVLNSLNRSVGMPDAYPFKLSTPVQEKLLFVHEVVLTHANGGFSASDDVNMIFESIDSDSISIPDAAEKKNQSS
ncbi:MAG TPA: putative zinc-binding metallopeptidase [Burkholderiaceae bacterium]|jgi:hypothetical protein|nr:putative zinc-binding metallopeptidase [Burkholderiaceae bacterium]